MKEFLKDMHIVLSEWCEHANKNKWSIAAKTFAACCIAGTINKKLLKEKKK